ncbi:hypothetical protein [Acidimangrovimonas sediminis]|uniref:hypothetical protein n=1 Tax=Acidimangrovimonas sediminis TaxID=2056283 RepID=UPI0018EB7089|nr:hypothetical protein [Acidimangrovimonas sediminis]
MTRPLPLFSPRSPAPRRARRRTLAALALLLGAGPLPAAAASGEIEVPAWLRPHVGDGAGQIAPVVLARARALHARKLRSGETRNPCYMAMDATRPGYTPAGRPNPRFYILCEARHAFRAVSAGHGSGRDLGAADFSNGRRCAANFGNASGSNLTTGGDYLTAETHTTFKGYYPESDGQLAALTRAFVQFDGEGATANARARQIGGHAAVLVRAACRMKDAASPYANDEGYVPVGRLVTYAQGRSNGCTSWTPEDARAIVALVHQDPATLYIYPAAADIAAVRRWVSAGAPRGPRAPYWNASCLHEIGAPRFWSQAELGPVIAGFAQDHPPRPYRPLPICASR